MVKLRSIYACQQCNYEQTRWFGKCPECGEWNSAVETVVEKGSSSKKSTRGTSGKKSGKYVNLDKVTKKSTKRSLTKISELDRVLGGGLVDGQVILIAGEPGIGKSTILMQVAENLDNVVYASGEESVHQLKIRADRLGIQSKKIKVMEETDIDVVIDSIQSLNGKDFPSALIIDSVQTMQTSDLSGMAGSVGQVKECAYRLVRMAKNKNIPVFIVGHVTKQGNIAGPAVLMHIVDTVLWFEGEKNLTLRLLRAVKNRFGPTDEVGVFSMDDKGLESVSNPEGIFLTDTKENLAGLAIASIMEGTRPILVEIQALVVESKIAYPKRIAQGVDGKRFELLLAVIQRRLGLPLFGYDCYISVSGGINIKNDPSADLAICMAIVSSYQDKSLPKGSIAIGEVGLLGDLREVVAQEKRVKEAKRLGYKTVISRKSSKYLREAVKKYLK